MRFFLFRAPGDVVAAAAEPRETRERDETLRKRTCITVNLPYQRRINSVFYDFNGSPRRHGEMDSKREKMFSSPMMRMKKLNAAACTRITTPTRLRE